MRTQDAHRQSVWLGLAAAIFLGGCVSSGGSSSSSGPAPVTEIGKLIYLNPGVTATAPGSVGRQKTRVSKSADQRVRWVNATTVPQKIQFSEADWIFELPYQSTITVDGGRRTEWFTIRADVAVGIAHPYGVVPLISGPPGEPSVTADP